MAKMDIVYWKDTIGGEKEKMATEAFPYGFTLGPRGEWEMLIAAEDAKVEANKAVVIKIRDVRIPARTIVMPCYFMRHALGYIPSLASVGRPYKIEEKRTLKEVLFHPIADGEIRAGELLAVVNIFVTTVERKLHSKAVERWMKERYRF